MKTLPVGELKAQFSDVLAKVQAGETFGIVYGKKKKPVAILSPFNKAENKKPRNLGILEGKTQITFAEDFKITEEEFLNLK